VGRILDPYWHKSRIAARLLLKKETRPWSARDRVLAAKFADDPGVSNRLIDQALANLIARRKNGRGDLD
jgi:hypothetical protein